MSSLLLARARQQQHHQKATTKQSLLLLAAAASAAATTTYAWLGQQTSNKEDEHDQKNITSSSPRPVCARRRTYVLNTPRGLLSYPGPAQCEAAPTSSSPPPPPPPPPSFRGVRRQSVLLDYVSSWQTSTHVEAYPWVWLARNPHSTIHVFVTNGIHSTASSPSPLISKMQAVAKKDPHATLVLLHPPATTTSSLSSSSSFSPELRLFESLGVAVLPQGVERVDPHQGLLLTKDERLIEYDSLTVMWGGAGHTHTPTTGKTQGKGSSSVDDAVANLGEEEEEEEQEKKRPFQAPTAAAIRTHEAKYPFFGANPLQQQQTKSPLATLRAVSTHTYTHAHTHAPSINNKPTTNSTYKGKEPVCNGCSQIVKRKSLQHGGGGPGGGEGLHAILTSWRLSSTSDTWPWVWLAARGAGGGGGEGQGGLHVIVADGKQALDAVKERQQNNKDQQENIVVIGQTRGEVTLAELEEELGAAVVEGGRVEEVDPVHGIILLDDERLVEMSSIEFVHSSSQQKKYGSVM